MSDTFSTEQRSAIMRKVKSKGNASTELRLIALFKARGFSGWRRNYPAFGKPDFVFLAQKIAVFVDGCFWHGHDCRNTKPKDNEAYWRQKIERNRRRDAEVSENLRARGWTVVRFWECELRNEELVVERLLREGFAQARTPENRKKIL
jgi:DNA mismatch endonuclease (patch repair protein)